ncbi:MAG: aspartate aminotransferase family protein [Flavobacteriales bacterium]
MKHQEYIDSDKKHYLPVYARHPITVVKGYGSKVWDVEGKEYIDLLAGVAVNNLGHCHPAVVKAIQEQAEKLIHISNFFVSPPQVKLSERLCELSGLQKTFFTNSGAEAVEGTIKLARKYAHNKGKGGKVISLENSFHGRTMATVAMGKKSMQKGFEPIPEGFQQIPANDSNELEKVIDNDTAAVIIEPVQGEGGIHPMDADYLKTVRKICDKNDILLIFDEIQCGIGRTGYLFAKEYYEVTPDIMTIAKGLGGGTPIGAILSTDHVSEQISAGDHGTTFGGNPLVCAAALATINEINDREFLNEVIKKGEWLQDRIFEEHCKSVKEARGLGLMIGIALDIDAKTLVKKLLQKGIIANATSDNVLRLVPPLNIKLDVLEYAIEVIFETIKE